MEPKNSVRAEAVLELLCRPKCIKSVAVIRVCSVWCNFIA